MSQTTHLITYKKAQTCASFISHRLIQWQWNKIYMTIRSIICWYRVDAFTGQGASNSQQVYKLLKWFPLLWKRQVLGTNAASFSTLDRPFTPYLLHSFIYNNLYTGECWRPPLQDLHRKETKDRLLSLTGTHPLCARACHSQESLKYPTPRWARIQSRALRCYQHDLGFMEVGSIPDDSQKLLLMSNK